MPNTEQSIVSLGGIPEVEVSLEVSGMTQTPVDKTLTISDMAADAKTVGDKFADVDSDIYSLETSLSGVDAKTGADIPITGETGADTIATVVAGMQEDIAGIDAKTGSNIPITGETGADSIADAVSGAVTRIGTLEAQTGSDIPITSGLGADTIANAVEGAIGRIATLEGHTAEDLPLTGETGAQSVAQAVWDNADDIETLQETTETLGETVDGHTTLLESAVYSVNNETPVNGNVTIRNVDTANNLTSENTQNSEANYLIRLSGGDASISDGDAYLIRVMGNSVHTGYVEQVLNVVAEGELITATVDESYFLMVVAQDLTTELTFDGTTWSTDPGYYGITVEGEPAEGDKINITYVKRQYGSISNCSPESFKATGWNLYNNGFARVVKYSDTYGYVIKGTYSSVDFAESTSSTIWNTITPTENGNFTLPSSVSIGSSVYIRVSGGGEDTYIINEREDWSAGHPGDYEAYTESTIDLSAVRTAYFQNGMFSVGNIRDEINLNTKIAYSRIGRLPYTAVDFAEKLALVTENGYEHDVDSSYIYYVKPNTTEPPEGIERMMVYENLDIGSVYTVNRHGNEIVVSSNTTPARIETMYGNNLKEKLERDVLTISQQTLTEEQKAQARANVDSVSTAEMNAAFATLNGSLLVKQYSYKWTTSIAASGGTKSITAANFGITEIEGYKPIMVQLQSTGNAAISAYGLYAVTTGTVLALRNASSSALNNKTAIVNMLWMKEQLVGT